MSQARVPPGFRFHPTDEELLNYYLRKKTASENFEHVDIIKEVDLNKLEPWELHEKCRIGWSKLEEVEEWYFFSHKDKKYPSGSRTNRATGAGFWKATGRDKPVSSSKCRQIGMRKTLVFYKGRAPHGRKTEWIMHEYRLSEVENSEFTHEEGWVVCHVFKKYKHQIKPHESISTSSSSSSSEYQKLHSTISNNSPKKKTKAKTSTTSTSITKTTTNTNTNTKTNELVLTPTTPPICKQELVDQPELYQCPNSATNTTTNTSTNINTTTNTNTNTNTTNQDPTVHVGDITYLVADIESSLDNFTHSSFKTDWNLLRSLATEARFITFSDEPTRQHPLEYPSSCNVDLWSFPR